MKKNIIFISLLIALSGCVSDPPTLTKSLTTTTPMLEKKSMPQTPTGHTAFKLIYGNNPELEHVFNQYITTGKASNIIAPDFEQIAYNAHQQPVIKTKPTVQTVLSLEPGEHFTNVSCGDPSKWSYSAASSGSGDKQQTHILIEPLFPETSTTLTIATDRRLYTLGLVSENNGDSMRHVGFWYPENMMAAWNSAKENQQEHTTSEIDFNQANFKYRINSGWKPPSWKPQRVFDNGKKTFIEFPDNITNRDLPLLFTVENSQKTLVNYRVQGHYFVVDRIFKQAALVMGVGRKQAQVTIINQDYK